MADQDLGPTTALLESTARAMTVPDAGAFAAAVAGRLRGAQTSPSVRRSPARRPRRMLASAAATVLLASAAVAALAPPVRSAVGDLFGVNGVHITRAQPIPIPTTAPPAPGTTQPVDPVANLHLGTPTTLQAAAQYVHFTMRIPTEAGYQQPDVVLVAPIPVGGMASLVYLPRPGRPAVDGQGIAAILSEFRGRVDAGFFQKLASAGTTIEQVTVGGVPGYWLAGSPHEFFYVAPDGSVDSETIRLASDTLLWSAGGITYRFETGLSKEQALAVAASMR